MAERVQSYLDGHKIGRLFEKLMASIIKDMPNEPIRYLILVLQRMDQRVQSQSPINRHSLDKKSSGTTLLNKYGLELSGHPAPTRSGDDPHVLLPGGKSVAASWGTADFGGTQKHPARPSSAEPKSKRGYSKPWLSGGGSKESAKPASTTFQSKQDRFTKKPEKKSRVNSEEVSQPLTLLPKNTDKVKLSLNYDGVKTWSVGNENINPSGSVISEGSMVNYQSRKQKVEGIEDIGIEIIKPYKSEKMEVDNDRGSAKSNKKAKHKAIEQKMRLEALLKEKDSKTEDVTRPADMDSEDEAIEIMESTNDLQEEGVSHPVSCGVKLSKTYKSSDSGSNVQIKICARCAKVISKPTGQLSSFGNFSETYSDIRPMPNSFVAFSEVTASDDDFESVSEIGIDGARREVNWPVISDSEGEERSRFRGAPGERTSLEKKHMYKGNIRQSMLPDKKPGDFFETNAPIRSLQTALPAKPRYISDLESDVSEQTFPVESRNLKLTGGKAWSFKAPETGSEADSDAGLKFGNGRHA